MNTREGPPPATTNTQVWVLKNLGLAHHFLVYAQFPTAPTPTPDSRPTSSLGPGTGHRCTLPDRTEYERMPLRLGFEFLVLLPVKITYCLRRNYQDPLRVLLTIDYPV
jgi:hypothetical protein